MPIVLSLTGQIDLGSGDKRLSRSDARDWLARAAVWFEGVGDAVLDAQLVRDPEDKPVLLVVIHPASPPVEVRVGGSGKIRISATTTPAGPGYHQYLCRSAPTARQGLRVRVGADDCSDPTGYFATRNRADARTTLPALARRGVREATKNGRSSASARVHLPGRSADATRPADARVGRRGRRRALCGTDFFPWWNPDLDAAFYRNRALVRLWCDFTWRPPLTEHEGELADQIANDLATAFKLDPSAELPWAEWLELLGDDPGRRERRAVLRHADRPRAERRAVEARRAGAAVRRRRPADRLPAAPGARPRSMAGGVWRCRASSPASGTMTGTGLRGTRRGPSGSGVSGSRSRTDRRRWPRRRWRWAGAACRRANRYRELTAGGVLGEAVFGTAEEDGRTVWRLSGVAGADGQLAVCNVYIEDPTDRDWAVKTWQSLRHGSG